MWANMELYPRYIVKWKNKGVQQCLLCYCLHHTHTHNFWEDGQEANNTISSRESPKNEACWKTSFPPILQSTQYMYMHCFSIKSYLMK